MSYRQILNILGITYGYYYHTLVERTAIVQI